MRGKISVGTASWADPAFIRDWYPPDLPAAERLPYYAAHFNLVELNSSFYAVPSRSLVERWCEQTPPDFTFDVKLHRLLSRHSTSPKNLPPELRTRAEVKDGKVQLTAALERALTKTFLHEIEPLCASHKLGAFLLQLTPAFGPHRHQLEELDTLIALLADHPLAVELRNRNWLLDEQRDRTAEFFRRRALTFVGVDAPATEHFTAMPSVDIVSNPKLAYVRLHGRNAEGYLSGKSVAERFEYLYSDQELEAIAQRAAQLAEQAAQTHIIYNNNASDYALRNAATFQQMIARQTGQQGVRPAARPGTAPQPGRSQTVEFEFASDPSVARPAPGRR